MIPSFRSTLRRTSNEEVSHRMRLFAPAERHRARSNRQTAEPRTVSQVLDRSVTNWRMNSCRADAMPEDKYSFVPTNGEFKGVRTFGDQVKHVAAVNYILAAAVLGEKPPVDTGEESGRPRQRPRRIS
jgi:hypothetical protein